MDAVRDEIDEFIVLCIESVLAVLIDDKSVFGNARKIRLLNGPSKRIDGFFSRLILGKQVAGFPMPKMKVLSHSCSP